MSLIDSFSGLINDGSESTSVLSSLMSLVNEGGESDERYHHESSSLEERREEARKRLYNGVEVRNRRYRFKIYKRCFVASEAVDFMVQSGWATSREEAVVIGRHLQKEFNLFEHVVDPERHRFDDKCLFFKFNSWDESMNNITKDDSMEGSSDDEESDLHRRTHVTRSLLKDKKRLGLVSMCGILQRGINQKFNFNLDKQGFYADEMVDYMVTTGLANSRSDAESIGLALQSVGRMIQNVKLNNEPFVDKRIFFVFTEDASSCEFEVAKWKQDLKEAKTFFEANIKLVDHTYRLKTYTKTFSGKEAVDLLLIAGITSSRQDAVLLGRALMVEFNLFGHVCDEHEFEDSELFYKLA